tara:strand:- start:1075 stop:1410 length:336 start_codon:yes stop_codon:yes gene_type:complete
MATAQENIKTELTKLAIKFKDISAKGGKAADYKEIENSIRRIRENYSETLLISAVNTFNTRVGNVTLTYADVITALGFVPGIGGGTNSNVLIDGGVFTSPNNALIDAGNFV